MSVQQSVHNKSSVSRLWLHHRLPHPVRAIADRYVCGYAAQPVRSTYVAMIGRGGRGIWLCGEDG